MKNPNVDPMASVKIDAAFAEAEPWAATICAQLRTWIHEAVPNVTEDWKWGPNFYFHGMCFGIWHFKKHVSFIFYNGAILDDAHGLLVHGKDNLRIRMAKFTPSLLPNEAIIKTYIVAAAAANQSGIKPKKESKVFNPDPSFVQWLNDNKVYTHYTAYSVACQREFYKYVQEAKREETRLRRLEKIKPMLLQKIKLNEKYGK